MTYWIYSFLIIFYPYFIYWILSFYFYDKRKKYKFGGFYMKDILYPVISHVISFILILIIFFNGLIILTEFIYKRIYNSEDKKLLLLINKIDPYDEEYWDDNYKWSKKIEKNIFYRFLKLWKYSH